MNSGEVCQRRRQYESFRPLVCAKGSRHVQRVLDINLPASAGRVRSRPRLQTPFSGHGRYSGDRAAGTLPTLHHYVAISTRYFIPGYSDVLSHATLPSTRNAAAFSLAIVGRSVPNSMHWGLVHPSLSSTLTFVTFEQLEAVVKQSKVVISMVGPTALGLASRPPVCCRSYVFSR